jgi:hypothetical protein
MVLQMVLRGRACVLDDDMKLMSAGIGQLALEFGIKTSN